MKTVLDFKLSRFPADGIVLPVSPVISIDSIKYYDGSNVEQTWASTNYFYNVSNEPCRIMYVNDVPDVYDYRLDNVTVRFTIGYSNESDTATQQSAVPPKLKAAILKLVGDLYAVRQDSVRERFTAWQMMAYSERVFHFPLEND